jgi:hypothetical protein
MAQLVKIAAGVATEFKHAGRTGGGDNASKEARIGRHVVIVERALHARSIVKTEGPADLFVPARVAGDDMAGGHVARLPGWASSGRMSTCIGGRKRPQRRCGVRVRSQAAPST